MRLLDVPWIWGRLATGFSRLPGGAQVIALTAMAVFAAAMAAAVWTSK